MSRSGSSSGDASNHSSLPSSHSTEVTLDFDAAPGAIAASAVVATTTTTAGRSDGVIHIEHPKNWKSPQELGVAMPADHAPAAIPLKGDGCEPINNSKVPGGRERSLAAIKSTLTPAAAAAAAAYVCSPDPSLVTSVNYKGQEVLFGTLPRRKGIVGWCARTRVTLQTLDVPDGVVVRLFSHPGTGLVVAMFANGECRTYLPRPTPAQPGNELSAPFGRFRWISGPKVRCRDFVVSSRSKEEKPFRDDNVQISTSLDYKLLVAHQNQVCVFDVAPRDSNGEEDFLAESKRSAELVWTTQVDGIITHARMSGDGRAIVYTIKGEGVENDNPFGCRMFLRDEDDGTSANAETASFAPSAMEESKIDPERIEREAGPGILFKPGPFLIHEASVSFLSFRGFGCNTSGFHEPSEESNDLLLTYCEDDNSVRIFSQNSWKQLMQWTTPPQTRADWVRGSSLFNLGDLEPNKKKGSKGSSAAPSRRPSLTSNEDSEGSAFQAAVGTTGRGGAFHHHQTPNQHHPFSAAGAWIAEVTFRSAFPALRLSRLSYMKRGSDEAQPAHFESVAAILPAGSVFAESVLPLGDMGMTIDGIWPALNPFVSDSVEGTDVDTGTLKGSAMAFLGLNNVSPHQTGHGYFGDSPLGGTHSPPSELRLAASHPSTGKVVVMEFPLWGDQDFGAMELGSPLRYLLSLGEIDNITQPASAKDEESRPQSVSLDYETSILSARIEKGNRTIGITWRKQGTGMLLPLLPCTPLWKQPMQLELPPASTNGESDKLQDVSTVPIPLSLPSLRLPKSADTPPNEKIEALAWWPDENYGGPPQLLAFTGAGSLYLYEMPPPWSALEPAMPSYDPFSAPAATPGGHSGESFEGHVSVGDVAEDEDSIVGEDMIRREYDVMITPHPDFGIGLRLEAQLDGMPAVAGSYKKHPLNGGMLPAEKTGMIVLGDELLSANGVSLEGLTFDEIIATVRQVGGDAPPNEALCMRFRPSPENRRRANSSAFSQAGSVNNSDDQMSHGSSRRTKDEIIGIKKKGHRRNRSDMSSVDADKSISEMGRCVTLPSGVSGGEMQQEFSRIIASILGAIPISKGSSDLQSRLALMPWTFGLGAPDPHRLRCAALLVVAEGSTIHAMRLEVAADCDAEKARCKELGSMELKHGGKVEHLEAVKTGTDNWCVAVWDSQGHSQLVFIDILERPSGSGGKDDPRVGAFPSSPEFRASFRRHAMFDARSVLKAKRLLGMRAHTVDFVATLTASETNDKQIVVWTAKPSAQTLTNAAGEDETTLYADSVISLQGTTEIVDFRFLSTGSLETAPRVVVFTQESVVVFQLNPLGLSHWEVVLEVGYPRVVGSSLVESYSMSLSKSSAVPSEVFPHLLDSLRGIIAKSDDKLVADWHPNAILSSICCHENGVKVSLKTWVKAMYTWMAKDESEGEANYVDSIVDIMPWTELSRIVENAKSKDDDDDEGAVESAAMLMTSFGRPPEAKSSDEQKEALEKLQKLLAPEGLVSKQGKSRFGSRSPQPPSRDLPSRLAHLNKDERIVMWAIGELIAKQPKFGKLDESAQLALFGASLMGAIQRTVPDDKNEDDSEAGSFSATFIHPSAKGQTRSSTKPKLQFSSSCGIAALTSDTQNRLLEVYRSSAGDFDWEAAKAVRLSFWLRSDDKLRKLSEEVGQQVYRQNRDIMECAIFFIIARNRKKLAALSATDKSETGRKFFKFLSSYNFGSDRGRKAAEKNAYSLLRKHKYSAAAAFFLLPEPPMLKTALETIVTKTNDLDMAFLVARLVESAAPSSIGLALSMMGGGGGYAVGFAPQTNDAAIEDEQTYVNWKPKLGRVSRNLLQDRGLSMAEDDMCLSALQLLWLGRSEEAAHALSGAANSTKPLFSKVEFPTDFDQPIPPESSYVRKRRDPFSLGRQGSFSYKQSMDMMQAPPTDAARAAAKANKVIDFVTRPFLAKVMRASARAKWTCSLLIGNAMTRRGIELPASRCMLSTTHPDDLDANGHACAVAVAKSTTKKDDELTAEKESAFDGPPAKAKPDPRQSSHQAASSIFDSFDTPQPTKPSPNASAPMSSSIFDSFDLPKQPSKINGAMKSSIFDDFAPAPQKKPSESSGGHASSSIFDDFAPAPRPSNQQPGGQMESSIFDSFHAAPQKPKTAASIGNGTTSSIFDSFDNTGQESSRSDVKKQPVTREQSKHKPKEPPEPAPEPDIAPQQAPLIYLEWRNGMLANSIARRVLREVARLVDKFHGNSVDPPMKTFSNPTHSLVPLRATEVLRAPCDGDSISSSVKACVEEICAVCEADEAIVVEQALRILDIKSQPNKIVIAVLLHSAMDRVDLAEDIVRDAALGQIHRCESLAVANDDLVDGKNTLHHASSLFARRVAARVSWQLELCLWLHRGGVVPLSGIVLKETIVAVRAGLVLASWGRNHECLESMMRCEPDCKMDYEGGKQLWSSLKLITGSEEREPKRGPGVSSGGWEFLVDCRRDEATQMLRNRPPGSFIIRPHPQNNGVFTLSFKTNLVPPTETDPGIKEEATTDEAGRPPRPQAAKPVKKDDVVQHAIIRLSDAGFRCGSFGPFTTLLKLLEAVSMSLPFDLLFDKPPTEGIIKDEDGQPSPNAFFFRKFALSSSSWNKNTGGVEKEIASSTEEAAPTSIQCDERHLVQFGLFAQLLTLTEIRRQLSAVAAADYEDIPEAQSNWESAPEVSSPSRANRGNSAGLSENADGGSEGSLSLGTANAGVEEQHNVAARILRPLLVWCRGVEMRAIHEIAPVLPEVLREQPVAMAISEGGAIEVGSSGVDGGDVMLRNMIQPNSGVEFRTLRVGEGGESAMIILFSKKQAISYLLRKCGEDSEAAALERLRRMEKRRVIEAVAQSDLALKGLTEDVGGSSDARVSYRIVDPWEVEAVESREGETASAALGREHYYSFSVSAVSAACVGTLRKLDHGPHLLGQWTSSRGGMRLTKSIASVHPPWERDAGGDLPMQQGQTIEPTPYANSIRQHLYRNAIFRRLLLPQRFMALLQVELLDLKNLNTPTGASLSVYALLRLKRQGSSAPLSLKARTLDSAATVPVKIQKVTSGTPNAPASWGSLVRFRFPLPEDVHCDGRSFDKQREALFRGPPSVLQFSVYEKKFMSDIALGGADVKLDALANGGQLEEWVPLRSDRHGINWFARIRLTLRFELLCLPAQEEDASENGVGCPPSVGLRKIQQLSRVGGAHEDTKHKKSASTPDLLSYFESIVY